MTIRVLLADDHAMVRAGFRMILAAEPDIEVVGEAENGREAIEVARWRRPNIVLMDVQMPILDGIEATRQIVGVAQNEAAPRVLILTTFELDEYVYDALVAGASGFLLKNGPPEQLVEAVRTVAAGGGLLAPKVTRRVIEAFSRRARSPHLRNQLDSLTEREREILRLVADGLTNREIADRLVVGEATVKTHISNVLGKLGLRDRVQAVIFAYESGLVEPGVAR